ncbi:MAG: acyl carrier protein [Betaproteobacteria bacterium]|nr:acyl carrier protein [Betaproteobacteria bacterium]
MLALGEGAPVDPRRSIMEMGLDSLMAMELRNRLHAAFGVKVSVPQLLRGPSLAELGATLLEALERRGDDAAAGAVAPALPEPAWEEGSL